MPVIQFCNLIKNKKLRTRNLLNMQKINKVYTTFSKKKTALNPPLVFYAPAHLNRR